MTAPLPAHVPAARMRTTAQASWNWPQDEVGKRGVWRGKADGAGWGREWRGKAAAGELGRGAMRWGRVCQGKKEEAVQRMMGGVGRGRARGPEGRVN